MAEARQHEYRNRDEEGRPGGVAQREGRPPDAQERVPREETDARSDLPVLRRLLDRWPLRNEGRDEQHGNDVAPRVDEQDTGRADRADQEPADHGAGEQGRAGGRLEKRVRVGDLLLPLAEQLRDDHLLGREVGGAEGSQGEGDGEQHREGEPAAPVEHGDDEHQGRAGRVAEDHRPPRAEPSEQSARGQAQQRQASELGGHHEAGLGG